MKRITLAVCLTLFALIVSSVCEAAPTVSSITPDHGVDNGIIVITDLAGTGFLDGARVLLKKSGETDIEADIVNVLSAEQIECQFDITDADDGLWDVVVTNPDEESGRLNDGFEVTSSILKPGIALVKSGPDEAAVGDTITYTFTVQNTGNDVLYDVGVTDSLLWEGKHHIGTLVQNASATFEKTYTIPATATESVENVAVAAGVDTVGHTVSDENDHSVFLQTGLITLLKIGPPSAQPGDTVTYEFTVYNSSSEDFTEVRITDPLFGNGWSIEIGDLASYSSTTVSTDYTISADATIPFTNTATVTAMDAFGQEISDTSSYTTIAPSPPGSCTASSLMGVTMPPQTWWAFVVLCPLIVFGAVRRHRRVMT